MARNSVEPKTYRTFLALPLSELFLAELTEVIQQAQSKLQGIKWVLPEQVHITLHFFGKTSEQEIQRIRELVSPLTACYPPLHLGLEGIGVFPTAHKPRVIWVGVVGETSVLSRLQGEIENALGKANFLLEDRSFRPHATIGRVKDSRQTGKQAIGEIASIKTELRTINKITLFQSMLSPQGPHYESLETFYLSQKPNS
jgi:2'-5' RNA ligase